MTETADFFLRDAGTHQWLGPMTDDLVISTADQAARAEFLTALVVGIALVLVALNLWLLAERSRRRRAERDLYSRLFALETDRAVHRMRPAGYAAAEREQVGTCRTGSAAGRAPGVVAGIPPALSRRCRSGGGATGPSSDGGAWSRWLPAPAARRPQLPAPAGGGRPFPQLETPPAMILLPPPAAAPAAGARAVGVAPARSFEPLNTAAACRAELLDSLQRRFGDPGAAGQPGAQSVPRRRGNSSAVRPWLRARLLIPNPPRRFGLG